MFVNTTKNMCLVKHSNGLFLYAYFLWGEVRDLYVPAVFASILAVPIPPFSYRYLLNREPKHHEGVNTVY